VDTLALCYHAVSDRLPADLAVTPANLERQLRMLVRRGYRSVGFTEAVGRGEGKRLAITFDDGFRSVRDLGLPILERLGLTATLFVPTAFPGSEEPMAWSGIDRWSREGHGEEMLCLGVPELRDLAARGWEIGAHSHTHPHLSQLSPQRLDDELRWPKTQLEEWLERPCTSFAYPYGDFSPAVVEATGEAGYAAAAGLDAALPTGRPLLWPRIGVYREDAAWRYRLKISPLARRLGLARLRHPGSETRTGSSA
jgi:peptidoglycan/xylan/chitin deacetylase (PgdA/CDA1 family)